MSEFLALSVVGIVAGCIYALTAMGLVVTYTTSGIFNFAHGAVAFATAYLYYQLNTGLGVPIFPAIVYCFRDAAFSRFTSVLPSKFAKS